MKRTTTSVCLVVFFVSFLTGCTGLPDSLKDDLDNSINKYWTYRTKWDRQVRSRVELFRKAYPEAKSAIVDARDQFTDKEWKRLKKVDELIQDFDVVYQDIEKLVRKVDEKVKQVQKILREGEEEEKASIIFETVSTLKILIKLFRNKQES